MLHTNKVSVTKEKKKCFPVLIIAYPGIHKRSSRSPKKVLILFPQSPRHRSFFLLSQLNYASFERELDNIEQRRELGLIPISHALQLVAILVASW